MESYISNVNSLASSWYSKVQALWQDSRVSTSWRDQDLRQFRLNLEELISVLLKVLVVASLVSASDP